MVGKWELARYIIEAKKNIDTLIYINENAVLLRNINLREKIKTARHHFYINCAIALEKAFPKEKKEICKNETIARIYYERDKFEAHKDEDYKEIKFQSIHELIEYLQEQLETVMEICREKLPTELTLDYVEHDPELFRLIHRVNADIETDINKIKYPRGVFHSTNLLKEGQQLFAEFDTTEEDKRVAKIFGYDYDQVVRKNVVQDADDIRNMTEKEIAQSCILFQKGINYRENLQKWQDSCIQVNIMYHLNMWVSLNLQQVKEVEILREQGFFDDYGIIHLPPKGTIDK